MTEQTGSQPNESMKLGECMKLGCDSEAECVYGLVPSFHACPSAIHRAAAILGLPDPGLLPSEVAYCRPHAYELTKRARQLEIDVALNLRALA